MGGAIKSRATQRARLGFTATNLVGSTGIEPVTPTMSR